MKNRIFLFFVGVLCTATHSFAESETTRQPAQAYLAARTYSAAYNLITEQIDKLQYELKQYESLLKAYEEDISSFDYSIIFQLQALKEDLQFRAHLSNLLLRGIAMNFPDASEDVPYTTELAKGDSTQVIGRVLENLNSLQKLPRDDMKPFGFDSSSSEQAEPDADIPEGMVFSDFSSTGNQQDIEPQKGFVLYQVTLQANQRLYNALIAAPEGLKYGDVDTSAIPCLSKMHQIVGINPISRAYASFKEIMALLEEQLIDIENLKDSRGCEKKTATLQGRKVLLGNSISGWHERKEAPIPTPQIISPTKPEQQ